MLKQKKGILKMVFLSMLIAFGVVISPLLRIEGMCPMAHFINIVCAVLLGPWYALLCATLIGILRMIFMGIPPLALTGAVFGAFLSGVCYRITKGKLLFAVLGEVVGTGVIGAVMSYPIMTFLWGKDGISMFFYVPSFLCGTLIGGSIAFIFLKKLSASGMLTKLQRTLHEPAYPTRNSIWENTFSIAALGAVFFLVIEILTDFFEIHLPCVPYVSYGTLILCCLLAVFYFIRQIRKEKL